MSLVSRRIIDTTGVTIQVTDTGDGEPALVFLHYWDGSSRTWQDVIDRLAVGPARALSISVGGAAQSRQTGDMI